MAGAPVWHLITPEFPPATGGVSDFVLLLAARLAADGEEVEVWCPTPGGEAGDGEPDGEVGVPVHPTLGRFRIGDLWHTGRRLNRRPRPRRLFVQWVPHGYGWRSLNLPFCLWIWARARLRGDEVQVMAHEPFLSFREGNRRQDLAAAVHRLMVIVLLAATRRVWVSVPAWEDLLRPWTLGRKVDFGWLPLPATIPPAGDPAAIEEARRRLAPRQEALVGHFGTYAPILAGPLAQAIPALLDAEPELIFLLLGRGGEAFREAVIEHRPELAPRLVAPGRLPADALSAHLAACDLLLQPYPDGASSRRTSLMAGLAHGRPIVTTRGRFTESCWDEGEAVRFVPAGEPQRWAEAASELLADEVGRRRLGRSAQRFYEERFDLAATVHRLRVDTEE